MHNFLSTYTATTTEEHLSVKTRGFYLPKPVPTKTAGRAFQKTMSPLFLGQHCKKLEGQQAVCTGSNPISLKEKKGLEDEIDRLTESLREILINKKELEEQKKQKRKIKASKRKTPSVFPPKHAEAATRASKLARAIEKNRGNLTMDEYYKEVEALTETYMDHFSDSPWVLHRIMRIMDRGFVDPSKSKLERGDSSRTTLQFYFTKGRSSFATMRMHMRSNSWKDRATLLREITEAAWACKILPKRIPKVTIREIIMPAEAEFLSESLPGENLLRIFMSSLPLEKQVPMIRPHVEVVEKIVTERDLALPKVQFYEDLSGEPKNTFVVLKTGFPKWRVPTQSGQKMEKIFNYYRVERELDRNIRRRGTSAGQLPETILEETSDDDLMFFDSSEKEFSESEEDVGVMEAFDCLESPFTPLQSYRWGVVEPGSEKEFLELCYITEKERQEAHEDNLLDDSVAESPNHGDDAEVESKYMDKIAEDVLDFGERRGFMVEDDSEDEAEEDGAAKEGVLTPNTPALTSTESTRISLKTRKYFISPRSLSDSSYHQMYNGSPMTMTYPLSYFLTRWPKSTNADLPAWVSEVKKLLEKCEGRLGFLEKKEYEIVEGLVGAIQEELDAYWKQASSSVKDGRTLDLNKAYSKIIMKQGKGATASRIAEISTRLFVLSKKRAFPLFLIEETLKKVLPVLDIKKVFTGGGTRKHSTVNHITERRSGSTVLQWTAENAFKNPRNTRARAAAALSKELLSMTRPEKPGYAHQQRAKIYAEIWALMGRADSHEPEEENKKSEAKKATGR